MTAYLIPYYLKERGFISADGFGIIDGNHRHLKLNHHNLYGIAIRFMHLHGSYRFEKRFGTTYKTREGIENLDPVIVFNNPNQKEEIINKDSVLREYFNILKKSLATHDKLIIIGNSMANEPHLKSIIKEFFNKPNQLLYACSRNPSQISKQLEGYYDKSVMHRSTSNISTIKGVLNLIEEIINHVP